MKEIKAFIRPDALDDVLDPLYAHPEIPGVTISNVRGFGRTVGRGNEGGLAEVQMLKLECIVPDSLLEVVLTIVREHARSGRSGDGKIAVYDVIEAVSIRTGRRIED